MAAWRYRTARQLHRATRTHTLGRETGRSRDLHFAEGRWGEAHRVLSAL